MAEEIRQRIRDLIEDNGENPTARLVIGAKDKKKLNKVKKPRKKSEWVKFIQRTRKEEDVSFKEAMKIASKLWPAEKRRLGLK